MCVIGPHALHNHVPDEAIYLIPPCTCSGPTPYTTMCPHAVPTRYTTMCVTGCHAIYNEVRDWALQLIPPCA